MSTKIYNKAEILINAAVNEATTFLPEIQKYIQVWQYPM